ncbi:proton-conducting transporter membrane subunit [Candidatus Chlorohelix sp.]|uniref:proton-conducting transporter transmembrane domain-containing protein n=1 Tax=Candidatus Chlorohelix sp. TaxID=3139201 RepID=UPI00306D312E
MNPFDILLPISIILPLIVGVAFFFFGWLFETEQAALASLAVLVSIVTLAGQIVLGFGVASGNTSATLFSWSPLPEANVQVAFRADTLSYFFTLPLAILSFLVIIYLVARQPSAEEGDAITGGRLYGLLFLVEGSALAAFYSADLIWLYGWIEALGLWLYLLAGPGLRGASASRSSFYAYVVSVAGGFIILAPLLVIVSRNGGITQYAAISPSSIETLFFVLIWVGAMIKTAQFPFHAWSGSLKNLPGGAFALLMAGGILPVALYLPTRLNSIAGDRLDLFKAASPLLLPVGAISVLACGWMVAKEADLIGKATYAASAQFGFVIIALGLKQFNAAAWQFFALSLSVPILFLCGDLLQIENTPLLKKGRETPKPLERSPHYRGALIALYLLGMAVAVGLPLTPAYISRYTTLENLATQGYGFYLVVALVGLMILAIGLSNGLITFLTVERQTVDGRNLIAWIPPGMAGVLGLCAIISGFSPSLASGWVEQLPTKMSAETTATANANFISTGWLGLVVVIGALVLFGIYLKFGSVNASPAYQGGLLFGAEEEEAQRRRESKKKSLKIYKESIPAGFDDDFFKIGTEAIKPTAPRGEIPLRLSINDYFSSFQHTARYIIRIFDTGFLGGWFGGIGLKILGFIVWLLEWMTEKFYAALAALAVIFFIFLLTR